MSVSDFDICKQKERILSDQNQIKYVNKFM